MAETQWLEDSCFNESHADICYSKHEIIIMSEQIQSDISFCSFYYAIST